MSLLRKLILDSLINLRDLQRGRSNCKIQRLKDGIGFDPQGGVRMYWIFDVLDIGSISCCAIPSNWEDSRLTSRGNAHGHISSSLT